MARLESQKFSIIGKPRAAYLNSYMPSGTLSRPYEELGRSINGMIQSGARMFGMVNAAIENERSKNDSLILSRYQAECNAYNSSLTANGDRYDIDGARNFAQEREKIWGKITDEYKGKYHRDDILKRRQILDTGYDSGVHAGIARQTHRDKMTALGQERDACAGTFAATGDPDTLKIGLGRVDSINDEQFGRRNQEAIDRLSKEAEQGTLTHNGVTYRIVDTKDELEKAKANKEYAVLKSDVEKWKGQKKADLDLRERARRAFADSAFSQRFDCLIKAGDYDGARKFVDAAMGKGDEETQRRWDGIKFSELLLKHADAQLSKHEMIIAQGHEAVEDVERAWHAVVAPLENEGNDATQGGQFMTSEGERALLAKVDEADRKAADSGSDKAKVYAQQVRAQVRRIFERTAQNLKMAKQEGLMKFYPNGRPAGAAEREAVIVDMCGDCKSSPLYSYLMKEHARLSKIEANFTALKNEEDQKLKAHVCAISLAMNTAVGVDGKKIDIEDKDAVQGFFLASGVTNQQVVDETMAQLTNRKFADTPIIAELAAAQLKRYGVEGDPQEICDFLQSKCPALLLQCRRVGYGLYLKDPQSKASLLQPGEISKIYKQRIFDLFNEIDTATGRSFGKCIKKDWDGHRKGKNVGGYDKWYLDLPANTRISIKYYIKDSMRENVSKDDSKLDESKGRTGNELTKLQMFEELVKRTNLLGRGK